MKLAQLRQTIRTERARFYAFRVMPDGRRMRLTPFGRRVFGRVGLAWLKRYAKRRGWRIIVKRMRRSWRDEWLEAATWALAHEQPFHYAQIRPFYVDAIRERRLPISTDCSGSTVMLARAAGKPDPTGQGYDGGRTRPTYTGTLRTGTRRVKLEDGGVGGYIVYGRGAGVHVVGVVKPHPTNPLVISHGQENGPRLYRHADQVAYHGGYYSCHDPGD